MCQKEYNRNQKRYSISYQDDYVTVTIEVDENCEQIDDFINNLVRPLMLGAGYSHKNVDGVLGEY